MGHIILNLIIVILYVLSIYEIRKGLRFFIAGLIFQSLFLLYRTIYLAHLPVTDKYDILLMIGLMSAFLILLFIDRERSSSFYIRLLPAGFAFLSVFHERINTISPNMNSLWFYLHSLLFIIAFSLFAIGSAAGLVYLWNRDEGFESLQYKFILSGWLIFSLSLIAGSVWFFLAHGVYWLWTAKELWTTIVWLYYAFYLHGRFINSLRGPLASEIGVAGIMVLLFSYLGVTPVLGSPWTQF